MSRRIVWVDMARGLAMLTILWAHTSVYYADGFASSYTLTVLNALAVFFFVSGYLFMSPDKEFSVGHKLRSVFRSLVVPYLIFTLAILFLKLWLMVATSIFCRLLCLCSTAKLHGLCLRSLWSRLIIAWSCLGVSFFVLRVGQEHLFLRHLACFFPLWCLWAFFDTAPIFCQFLLLP